ncbi:MAG: 30S ribosomal protein S20 [Bacillota bacterium]
MPNIKSAKKRVLVTAEHRNRNVAKRSELRSSLKKAASSITAGNLDVAKSDLNIAVKCLDEAAAKGLIHKNQAARRKSRLTKKLNALAK